jgi:hypothetical protein
VSVLLDSLVKIGLAVGISIVAALVLLPIALLIAAVLHRIIRGRLMDRFGRLLALDSISGEVSDRVEMAIIGGLIGGIAFAALAPAIAPVMYDFHVETGVAEQPEPAVAVHELDGVSDERIAEGFDVEPGQNYSLYVVEIENDDQRRLKDYNFNVRFPGCVETSTMGATNFGTAVVTNESDRVHLGEFTNRSANATCYGAVQVEEFPPGNAVLVTFVVDHSPDESQQQLYPAPEASEEVLTTSSYTWAYNGRSYYEPAELTPTQVERHNATTA